MRRGIMKNLLIARKNTNMKERKKKGIKSPFHFCQTSPLQLPMPLPPPTPQTRHRRHRHNLHHQTRPTREMLRALALARLGAILFPRETGAGPFGEDGADEVAAEVCVEFGGAGGVWGGGRGGECEGLFFLGGGEGLGVGFGGGGWGWGGRDGPGGF